MRWAFWRRPARPHVPAAAVEERAAATPSPSARDEELDGPTRRTSPFSGARPGFSVVLETDPLDGAPMPAVPPERLPQVEAVVVDIVRAVLARDAAEVARLLDSLGADVEPAAATALAVLGPRVLAAADVTADEAATGGVPAAAALAQADTLVTRAEPLRRAVARDVSADLLHFAARCSLGADSPEVDAAPRAVLLAAAVLLARGIEDGSGGAAALADELAALRPD